MIKRIKSLFFSVIPARRAFSRVRAPHYKLSAVFQKSDPEPLTDLPQDQVERINLKSDEYFENNGLMNYWKNKPLSDLEFGPHYLWRFGLLLAALGIRPEDRVLDFGCGTGWTSMMIARTGAEVTAMDISEKALAIAEQCAKEALPSEPLDRLRFRQFNGSTIDFPDEYFDFVLVFDAFHHLPNPFTILKEFARVLNSHGYFGFAEPGHGHSETEGAHKESEHGILEKELDPEQIRSAGRTVGFQELHLIVPPVLPGVLTLPMPRARWYLRGLPWLVPHDYIRASILSSPIGILRKGPYITTSLHPQALLAVIQASPPSIQVRSLEKYRLQVSVVNQTGTVWLKVGRRGSGYVRLGAHLLNSEKQTIVQDYGRAEIPHDMLQGDRSLIDLDLIAPQAPGEYWVQLDMVDEGIAWFAEKGSKPGDVKLIVTI